MMARPLRMAAVLAMGLALAACTPTVRVEPPSEPITINLNVKIDHEIRVKVDRERESLFSEDSDLKGIQDE